MTSLIELDELLERDPGERAGIRLTETERVMLRAIAASWYPGEQRKHSQAVRRLIREEYARLLARDELVSQDAENPPPGD